MLVVIPALSICFVAVSGLLVVPVGQLWAAYSPLSGETTLLNDASAAILEVLVNGPLSQCAVCADLGRDTGQRAEELVAVVEACWPRLVDAGLVRQVAVAKDTVVA